MLEDYNLLLGYGMRSTVHYLKQRMLACQKLLGTHRLLWTAVVDVTGQRFNGKRRGSRPRLTAYSWAIRERSGSQYRGGALFGHLGVREAPKRNGPDTGVGDCYCSSQQQNHRHPRNSHNCSDLPICKP